MNNPSKSPLAKGGLKGGVFSKQKVSEDIWQLRLF